MGLFEKYKKNNVNEAVDWEKSMDGNDNNLDRIKRLKNLQVDISPVMGDALEDDEKFDKNSKEVFTKLAKDAESVTPKDPDTGKKIIIKPYTEKLTLDEGLFKESIVDEDYNTREYSDMLYDMLEADEVNAKDIVKDLIYWCSEDDIERFMRVNELIFEDENEDDAEDSLEEKKSLNKELNLLEYASEDEEDDYTVVDLLNDRLFGYGINKSNFRIKWKFAEVEPTIKTRDGKVKRGYFYPTAQKDEMVTGKADDRRAFVEEGIGVLVHDEDEASLAKKCADELGLEFKMKKLVKPVNGCEYTAVIKVPEDVQEMTVEEYMKSIGKSMSDLLRGKGEKVKSNFKDSANYKSRKNKQDSE